MNRNWFYKMKLNAWNNLQSRYKERNKEKYKICTINVQYKKIGNNFQCLNLSMKSVYKNDEASEMREYDFCDLLTV